MLGQSIESANVRLVTHDAYGSTSHFDLGPDQGVFVGSSDNCGLKLRGEHVAAIHCRIERQDESLTVQDWMTADGTRVNGKAIDTQVQLRPGDKVQIDAVEIVVETADSGKVVQVATEPESGENAIADESGSSAAECYEQESEPKSEPENPPETVVFDRNPFNEIFDADDEDEMFDRETVELLQTEIDELRSVIARYDAERTAGMHDQDDHFRDVDADSETPSGALDHRMQQLVDEANRSDERVALLEEMLYAAEEASRSEQDERAQIEAWVSDIEAKIGEREAEHQAELNALREQLETANQRQQQLLKKLQSAGGGTEASAELDSTLRSLQEDNNDLRQRLIEAEKKSVSLEKQMEDSGSISERELREERAKIAQEQAKISRMRYELSQKLQEIEHAPKPETGPGDETSTKIQALREHLREIHQQEKQEEKEASLTSRLAKLWKRVEY